MVDYASAEMRNVELLQTQEFRLSRTEVTTRERRTINGNKSELIVCFHVERKMGYYIVQAYIQLALIVALSQISFWINKEATPARMIFGSNAVLSLVLQSMSLQKEVPQASDYTALHVYIMICYVFCFAAAFEYALVNYATVIAPRRIMEKMRVLSALKDRNNSILILERMRQVTSGERSTKRYSHTDSIINNLKQIESNRGAEGKKRMKREKKERDKNSSTTYGSRRTSKVESVVSFLKEKNPFIDRDAKTFKKYHESQTILSRKAINNAKDISLGQGLQGRCTQAARRGNIPNIYSGIKLNQSSRKQNEYDSKIKRLAREFAPDIYKKCLDEEEIVVNNEIEKLLSQKALQSMTGDSNIDQISRLIFPICFIFVNFWYYQYYTDLRRHYLTRGYKMCGEGLGDDVSDNLF